jgi:hypothetical protein
MTEAEQNVSPAPADADATLLTPRFDEAEAQTAQPVVPLAEVSTRRRVWPLILLSAVLGGAVSVFGLYLYQRPRAQAQTAQSAAPQQAIAPAPALSDSTQNTPQMNEPRAQAAGVTRDAENARADVAAALPVERPKAAEHPPVAARREPAKQGAEKKAERSNDREQPTRAASAEVRPRRVGVNEERHDADARRRGEATTDRPARYERPRTAQVEPPPRPRARNVDRIRDIFEGAHPPV